MKVGVRNASGRFVRSFDVLVKLPWGNIITLIVQHTMTVEELQSLIEFSSGIPSQLFRLSYKSQHILGGYLTLQEVRVTQGTQFRVTLLPDYDRLMTLTVKGNFNEVMDEINRFNGAEELAFRKGAVLYLSAHKGHQQLVDRYVYP